jgi:acetyl-CoA carboxylase carboxyl transferase subunit beta
MSTQLTARELIALVLDDGSFESWDDPIDLSGHPPVYRGELHAAAVKSGLDESVLTGRGVVCGHPVAVIVNEFRFLGGSIGVASARRISTAVRRATAERLPIVATTASGGTRMQEGTPAFVQMIEISRAIMDHKALGLPYLVHLRNPTTGGVFASWGSLGHITIAEPGALIAFLGPRVFEVLNGRPFPAGVQLAENLVRKGVIDGVVSTERLADMLHRVLGLLTDPADPATLDRRTPLTEATGTAWDSIVQTRRKDRLGVREIIRFGGEQTVRLHGTDEGERDSAIVVAITRLDGLPCVVVGQDRRSQTPETPMGPAALREARRAMSLASELRLPLVTFIDTPGAELSAHAEEKAIAGEIARCIGTLVTMTVPTVSVLLGEGCGGGALALFPAARIIAAEHAWLAPLPPEGASAIVYGDASHAEEMANRQRIGAIDLLKAGALHAVVPEFARDQSSPRDLARAIAAEAAAQARLIIAQSKDGSVGH